jgi:hypothetical protein
VTGCTLVDGCAAPAEYVVTYDPDVVDGEWPMCREHTAEARANDPLGYIAGVRSLEVRCLTGVACTGCRYCEVEPERAEAQLVPTGVVTVSGARVAVG